ncbi:MAG: hypothetical protein EOO52_14980 [Gammaproteobacteria bacterium]|nr:MAG: hypothetical protein EOO52_14980 [Gammaproteobacteria bacterium]
MQSKMISAEELNLRLGKFCILRAERGLSSSPEDLRCLSNSIQYGHYSFLENCDGEIIAYVTWAKVNKEAYLAAKQKLSVPKYEYEWDEGPITLILDVLVKKGWENFLPKFLLAEARKQKFLCYLDKDKNSLKRVRYKSLH